MRLRLYFYLLILVGFIPFVYAQEEPFFEVDKPLLYATVDYGETTSLSFTLLNRGTRAHFSLSPFYDRSFFELERTAFDLKSDASASMVLTLGRETLAPGVYVGSVTISSDSGSRIVPVVLEVQRGPLLFDATIREFPYYSELLGGSTFSPQVIVYNLRARDPTVTLLASIYDLKGNRVSHFSQVVEVPTTLETSLALPLPSNLDEGMYLFGLELVAGSSYGTATTSLRAGSLAFSPAVSQTNRLYVYSLAIIAFLLTSFMVLNYLWRRRMVSSVRYWDQQLQQARTAGTSLQARKRLAYQRQLLVEAYSKGYISKQTYAATRARLDRVQRALKKRL